MAQPAQRTRFGRIFSPDEAWLAKAPDELILDPDLPIIDTHHHLWVRPDHRYLLHELLADLQTGHNVVATVFLQCHAMYRANGPEEMRPIGETEFVAGIAAMSDSGGYGSTRVAAGIVGFADLTLGDRVEAVLEAQIRAGGGRFRGVRHSGNWDADPIIGNGAPGPDVYRDAAFRAGLARLSALGLSLDAWVFHTQLLDVIDLARAFPATNIIMGHVGGVLGYGPYTGRRDEIFRSWKASMVELAQCPNVWCKLSGLITEAEWTTWKPVDLKRYIDHVLASFGPERVLFGSDWPVCLLAGSYDRVIAALETGLAHLRVREREMIFGGNAARLYQLKDLE